METYSDIGPWHCLSLLLIVQWQLVESVTCPPFSSYFQCNGKLIIYWYLDRRLTSFDWSQMSIGDPHLPSGFSILFRETLERLPFIRDLE